MDESAWPSVNQTRPGRAITQVVSGILVHEFVTVRRGMGVFGLIIGHSWLQGQSR
jgi:hypothetical protein